MLKRISTLNYLALIGLFFILLVNASVLSTIFDEWNSDGPNSHGFLGFAVVLYALWLKRGHFSYAVHKPSALALFLLLGSSLGLLINHLASVQQLQQLMLFALIVFYIASVYGFAMLKKLFFPLIMLWLILPVWSVFQTPLRELSTIAGDLGPKLFGIDVLRDDYRLSTYGGMFDVEPACSGLGFFLVAALFAVCVSFFNHLSLKKSLQFLLICLCFAIFANWMRIIIIIVVGSYTHMQHFIVKDHLAFGWAVFAVVLLPLIYLARHAFDDKGGDDLSGVVEVSSDLSHNPVNKYPLFLTYFILVSFAAMQYWIPTRFDEHYKFTLPEVADYKLVSENKASSPNWSPVLHGVSSESFNFVVKGAIGIQVYIANYIQQSQAHEMIYVENSLYDKQRWSKIGETQLALTNAEVNLLTLERGQGRARLIAYWYVVSGVHTADKKRAKLEEVKSAILGHPGASLIAFSLDYQKADETLVRAQMQNFAQAFFNNIQQ